MTTELFVWLETQPLINTLTARRGGEDAGRWGVRRWRGGGRWRGGATTTSTHRTPRGSLRSASGWLPFCHLLEKWKQKQMISVSRNEISVKAADTTPACFQPTITKCRYYCLPLPPLNFSRVLLSRIQRKLLMTQIFYTRCFAFLTSSF